MRYSANLRVSRRYNILKDRFGKSAVVPIFLALVFIISILIINFAHLSVEQLIGGFLVSLVRTSIAYLIALIFALIIALLITANQKFENILLPIFDVLQSFPSFALFPVLVQALRNSPEMVIISVLSINIIWPILFSIIGGIKNRREDLEEAATIFGATGFKRLIHFTLPLLFPSIVTGSIVGWGNGWEFIIGAELLVKVNIGVGSYLGNLGENQQDLLLAFGIVVLLLLLFIVNKIVWLPLLQKATEFESEA